MLKYILNKYENLSKTKKSIVWFTLASIIQNAISFMVTPIYTRILSEEEYGIYSLFQSWLQIIAIISVFALDRCITVGFIKFSNKRKQFLSSIQSLMTLLVFLWSIVVIIFNDFFEKLIELPLYMIIMMLLVSLMNNSLANWNWYQRYIMNYKKLTFVTVTSTIIIQVVSCFIVLLIPSSNKGILLIMIMSLLRIFLYGCIYISIYIHNKVGYNKEYWKFGLKYSIPIIPHALAQIVLNSSDRIMISKICGKTQTAYYSLTYSAAMVLNTILVCISSAIQPWYFEKIKNKEYSIISSTTNGLLVFSAILSIIVSLFAPEILVVLAPSSYKEAIFVFPSIAASIFFNSMYLYFANFESYYEKSYYFSVATLTGALINIILNYFLLPVFGFIVAGYTTLIAYIVFAIMHYLFLTKICNEQLYGIRIFNIGFIVFLSFFVILITIGITFLYKFTIYRYLIFLIIIVIMILKKDKIKKIILEFKN